MLPPVISPKGAATPGVRTSPRATLPGEAEAKPFINIISEALQQSRPSEEQSCGDTQRSKASSPRVTGRSNSEPGRRAPRSDSETPLQDLNTTFVGFPVFPEPTPELTLQPGPSLGAFGPSEGEDGTPVLPFSAENERSSSTHLAQIPASASKTSNQADDPPAPDSARLVGPDTTSELEPTAPNGSTTKRTDGISTPSSGAAEVGGSAELAGDWVRLETGSGEGTVAERHVSERPTVESFAGSFTARKSFPREKDDAPGSGPIGISGAQQIVQMKKFGELTEIADSGQHKLPGTSAASAEPAKATPAAARPELLGSDSSLSLSALSPRQDGVAAASLSSVEHVNQSSGAVPSARTGTLEQTHELVASHALRLQGSNQERLQVVIQPTDGVRLAIELHRSNGHIEAQAILQQGDFNHFRQHWGELQQRLEPQKVVLGALRDGGQPAGEDASSRQSKRHHNDVDVSAPTDLSFGGSMTESPANRSPRKRMGRGWETWA
jgi:hypothetical protein